MGWDEIKSWLSKVAAIAALVVAGMEAYEECFGAPEWDETDEEEQTTSQMLIEGLQQPRVDIEMRVGAQSGSEWLRVDIKKQESGYQETRVSVIQRWTNKYQAIYPHFNHLYVTGQK